MVAAIAVGFGLRLGWVVFATGEPTSFFSDAAQYLTMAEDMAAGTTPRLGDRPSAFFAPGYPLVLVPLVWLSDATGGVVGLTAAAAGLNVVVGTATIALVARLATLWLPASTRNWAAWMLAVAPGQIFMTSTVLTETVFAGLAVALVVALGTAYRGGPEVQPSIRRLAAIGVGIGLLLLVRNVGAVLVLLPLGLAGRRVLDRRSLRDVAVLGAAALSVLAPWTIRNGLEVGSWSPFFTGSASTLCLSHRDGATGVPDFSAEALSECYRGSPWDDPALYPSEPLAMPDGSPVVARPGEAEIDEARWFRERTGDAVAWAVRNPGREVILTARKTIVIFASDSDALGAAEDGGARPLVSDPTRERLDLLADLWLWSVLGLAAIALLRSRPARSAWVLWVVPGTFLLLSLVGIALNRYHHPMMPFLICLAAAAVAGAVASDRGARGQDPPPRVPA